MPQSVVDAFNEYVKANDDEIVSMDDFRAIRMELIDTVGDVVNSQGEVQS